jgi:hypothetical protein
MAENNPELQAKLQELERELEVSLPFLWNWFYKCRMPSMCSNRGCAPGDIFSRASFSSRSRTLTRVSHRKEISHRKGRHCPSR